jgi:hypothetical protein
MVWKSSMSSMLSRFNIDLVQLLTIIPRHIWEGLRQVWPDAQWPGQHQMNFVESRL